MTAHDEWLAVAISAAQEAGAWLRAQWRKEHTVQWKGFRDIVTEADEAAETMIIERLLTAFPDHAATGEESGGDGSEARVRWLIDPVDGTTNFSRHNPNFSVSIAAVEDGVPVVGVVADPLREQIFSAVRGGGARWNDLPMATSSVTELAGAICAFDSPRDSVLRDALWHRIRQLMAKGRTIRALGSAALNMAYVAVGWTDLYVSLSLHPWDQAATGLMVQEAGGVVGTVSGEPWTPYSRAPVMAASSALLEAFYDLMSEAQASGALAAEEEA